MDELERARQEIDRLDDAMRELFEARMQVCAAIAVYKKRRGLSLRDEARERELIGRSCARLKDTALAPSYAALLQELLRISRAHQAQVLADAARGEES